MKMLIDATTSFLELEENRNLLKYCSIEYTQMQQIINRPLSLFYFFTFKLDSTTTYTLSLSKYIVYICLQDTNTNTLYDEQ